MHLDLLRAVTPIRSHPRPLLRPRPDSGFADRFIPECGWDSSLPLVVIHPGARGRKQWPPEQFIRVVEQLPSRSKVNVALVWGPADGEAAQSVLRAANVRPAGILSFADFLSLVRRSSVFVSGDCGPMHLAAAAGARVVAIFLASDPGKYRPLGPEDVTLDGRSQPVEPDAVVEAILRLITRQQTVRQSELPFAETGRTS
jgi:ADP-heptose:LPS heptosyltransferase